MPWQLDSAIPPVKLEHYFFTDVQFEAFPAVKDRKSCFPPLNKPVIKVSRLDTEGRRWNIFLLVESEKPSEEKKYCFSFRLTVCGIFNWTGEDPANKDPDFVEKAVAVSGASILLGSCREFLQTIVSKGPYPGYKLPTIRFVPVEQESEDSQK